MTHPDLVSRHVTPAQCVHLRHKGMYVLSEVSDPGYADQVEATAFWCVCTQKSFGPDGRPVSPDDCSGARECCDC